MLLPWQRYEFTTKAPLRELQRKTRLLSLQTHPLSERRRWFGRRKPQGSSPLCVCEWEGDKLRITGMKSGGDEDMVRLDGLVTDDDVERKVVFQLKLTSNGLASAALSLVLGPVVGFLYLTIGERIMSEAISNECLVWLLVISMAVYFSLKQYSSRAEMLLEQVIYWLELQEEDSEDITN